MQRFLKFSHLPAAALVIGYACYWLELYVIRKGYGVTTPLAWCLLAVVLLAGMIRGRRDFIRGLRWGLQSFRAERPWTRCILAACFLAAAVMLAVAFYASLLPPHLPQEYDALNYHYTLPRQHLILHSFKHLSWSSGDLFLLPLDFALAPYWFLTQIPVKAVHFLFVIGLLAVTVRLVRRLSGGRFVSMALMPVAVLGSHFIGIQLGIAMLDLAVGYLFFAALDSLLEGDSILFGIESAFFIWAKPALPLQVILVAALAAAVLWLLKKGGVRTTTLGFEQSAGEDQIMQGLKRLRMGAAPFLFASVLIAGPFMAKSLYYAGTPLYPFAPGSIMINPRIDTNSKAWESRTARAREHLNVKDGYGHGRSLKAFIRHFWLIAVPEDGVNNRYDYPVGLIYLLFGGFFLVMFAAALGRGQAGILPLAVVSGWLLWWFGTQQSRFLYIPVLLMAALVLGQLRRPGRVFLVCVLIALLFTALSVVRAHRKDFGLRGMDILRGKDRILVAMNQEYRLAGSTGAVAVNYNDAAFAQFPVDVTDGDSPWVLKEP